MGKSGKGTVTSMKTKKAVAMKAVAMKAVAMKAVAMKAVASTTPMASSTEGHDGSTNKHPQPPKTGSSRVLCTTMATPYQCFACWDSPVPPQMQRPITVKCCKYLRCRTQELKFCSDCLDRHCVAFNQANPAQAPEQNAEYSDEQWDNFLIWMFHQHNCAWTITSWSGSNDSVTSKTTALQKVP